MRGSRRAPERWTQGKGEEEGEVVVPYVPRQRRPSPQSEATKKGKPKGPPVKNRKANPVLLTYGSSKWDGFQEVIYPSHPLHLWATPRKSWGALALLLWLGFGAVVAVTQLILVRLVWLGPSGGSQRFLASIGVLVGTIVLMLAVPRLWPRRIRFVHKDGEKEPRTEWRLSRVAGIGTLLTGVGLLFATWQAVETTVLLVAAGWLVLAGRACAQTSEAAAINGAFILRGPVELGDEASLRRDIRAKWERMISARQGIDPVTEKTVKVNAGHPLRGSKLTEVTLLPRSEADAKAGRVPFTARVHLDPDSKATWETVLAEAPRIAMRYKTRRELIFASPDRDGEFEGFVSLSVYTTDPLLADVVWSGPTYEGGKFEIATMADGTTAKARLFQGTQGVVHTAVYGETGAGKSSATMVTFAEACLSRRFATMFLDVDGGASVPGLAERCDFFAGNVNDVELALLALDRYIDGEMQAGRINFKPIPSKPGLIVFLDEARRALSTPKNPENRESMTPKARTALLSSMVARSRKAGVAFVITTQHPKVEDLGGDAALRANLMAGNTIMYRIADLGANSIATGTVFDAAPKIGRDAPKGVAYIAATGEKIPFVPGRVRFLDSWDTFDALDEKAGARRIPERAEDVLAAFAVSRKTANV